MKGITPVIAIILLLMITISMVGFTFVWFTGISSQAQNAAQEQQDSLIEKMGKQVSIENVDVGDYDSKTDGDDVQIRVRNIGTKEIPVSEISFVVAGTAVSCGNTDVWTGTLDKDTTMDCEVYNTACGTGDQVKVSSPGNEALKNCPTT